MIINIDGNPVEEGKIEGGNLEDILVELQQDHLPPNRLVGEVLLNGLSYSEDLPHAAVEVARSDIASLELVTRTPEEIALHFINNGALFIDAMLNSLPEISEMFRLGDEAEASEHYLRFLESLHLLISMLEKVSGVMDIHFDLPSGDHGSVDDRLEKLAQVLSQLARIQEETDWIYLADILEYELTPELEALRNMLPNLRGRSQ